MTVQSENTDTISLQIKESAALELVKAQDVLKQNATGGAIGWLAHLSKILEVFEAIDQSNTFMLKEDTQLNKANYLKQILYNAISNCSSLDQLKDFFNSYAKSIGPFAAQDPSFGNLISQVGGMISNAEQGFLNGDGNKKNNAYFDWLQDQLPIYTNIFQSFDKEGSEVTKANIAFEKNTETELSTLVSSMNTLATMSVQSLTDPDSTSGIQNRDS